jgi:hypothetical protein
MVYYSLFLMVSVYIISETTYSAFECNGAIVHKKLMDRNENLEKCTLQYIDLDFMENKFRLYER